MRARRRPWIALALAAWGAAAPLRAQDGPEARAEVVRLTGEVELVRLVDLAAARLGIDVEYDAASVKGTVTLRLADGIEDAELWGLANRLLAARGFTTVRMAGSRTLSVVRLADAAGLARLEFAGEAQEPVPAGFRAVAVELVHADARAAADAVSKALSKPAGAATPIEAAAGRRLLVVADLAPRVERALEVLALLDRPRAGVAVERVALEHVPAARLALLAAQVSAKRAAISGAPEPRGEILAADDGSSVLVVAPEQALEAWRALVAELDRREPVTTTTYAPSGFGAGEVAGLVARAVGEPAGDDRFRVVVDELAGGLIVTATAEQHARIEALLERLAQAPPDARRATRAYPVRHRDVAEVLDLVRGLTEAGVVDAGQGAAFDAERAASVQRAQPGEEGARREPARPVETRREPAGVPSRVTLTADPGTNTLIAVAEARQLDRIGDLVRGLDVRQPQVMIEVSLVTLTESETFQLGVELESIERMGGTTLRLASLFGLSSGAGGTRSVGDPAGLTGLILSPGDFAVVVRALETVGGGRSVSMPRVLVRNNQQAVFDSVVEQPFASTNASDTVATTSFGGSSRAGTIITVRPRVADGGHLTLEYALSLSAFIGAAADPNLPPPRQENRVESVSTVPDGSTVVVGGIDLASLSRGASQVPLIARVPLLGELFKSRSSSATRSRFFVFIRASVLRSASFEDLRYLTDAALGESGLDDDWPDVSPRVIR